MARQHLKHSLKGVWEGALLGNVASVTGLVVDEAGLGVMRRTTFRFTNVAFALTDVAGVVAFSGKKIYDWPEGWIKVVCAVADLALTKSAAGVNATWNGDFGLGTVTASNNATLSSTEQDIIPTTATPAAVAGVSSAKGANAADIAPLDGHTTAKDLFLNFLVDDADQDVTTTPTNLIVNGTVVVHWLNAGDYT
jgi:hypothetical protein